MLLQYFIPRRKEGVLRFALVAFVCFMGGVTVIHLSESPLWSDGMQKLEQLYGRRKVAIVRSGNKVDATTSSVDSVKVNQGISNSDKKDRKAFAGDIDVRQSGPGEGGSGVRLYGKEKDLGDESMKKWFMNVVASDKISLDRTLRDVRSSDCKALKYNRNLPSASVVIIFHNEAWTPLIRTVHSVINRSPPDVLHEVVMLDDASDRDELQENLDKYIKRWNGKVHLVRKAERQGLIRARVEGARAATGDVLVFLDSHCEASHGWLEPLLQRIKEKRSAVLCPMIDVISDHDMAYFGGGGMSVGGFWWSLHFKWTGMQAPERKRRKTNSEPFRSPTMAGGLFAADRKYFFEIGAYDEGMDIWGGENLEISFRTWMCGGSLEFVPCSHVGHIFRAGHPYNMTTKDVHGINSARLAEVWMDDYKRLFYNFRHDLKKADIGNISNRVALRKRLNCHSFKWYLDNVYPEKFVPDENVLAWGQVKNPTTGFCLDTLQRDEKSTINVGVFHCQSGGSSAQIFSLSRDYQLRREDTCMSVSALGGLYSGFSNSKVSLSSCYGYPPADKTLWNHTREGSIVHVKSGLCLDTKGVSNAGDVMVQTCADMPSQRWTFQNYLDIH